MVACWNLFMAIGCGALVVFGGAKMWWAAGVLSSLGMIVCDRVERCLDAKNNYSSVINATTAYLSAALQRHIVVVA